MTLACIQRRVVFACLLFSSGWAAAALWSGCWPWPAGGFVLLATGYLTILGTEFLLLFASYSRQKTRRPCLIRLLTAVLREVPCALAIFIWRQPFSATTFEDLLICSRTGGRGLILVHGLFCNRGFWNPWLRRLRVLGIPFIAVNLEPVFGSIDAYASQIDAANTRMRVATGATPILVGHSMGGLAIRAWLATSSAATAPHHIVTIGTPHHGTLLANHSRRTNGRQMRCGSDWLANLRQREKGATGAPYTCFWSRCDNVVFPTESATLPGADNRALSGMPHMAMAFHPAVFRETLRLLKAY